MKVGAFDACRQDPAEAHPDIFPNKKAQEQLLGGDGGDLLGSLFIFRHHQSSHFIRLYVVMAFVKQKRPSLVVGHVGGPRFHEELRRPHFNPQSIPLECHCRQDNLYCPISSPWIFNRRPRHGGITSRRYASAMQCLLVSEGHEAQRRRSWMIITVSPGTQL